MNLFRKRQRIAKSSEFTSILKRGRCVADGTLVLFASPQRQPGEPRLGVTIPKRVGNAVIRNRWKRLIRESFRTQQDSLPPGFDYVVRPKKDAVPNWRAIARSLPRLANKAVNRH